MLPKLGWCDNTQPLLRLEADEYADGRLDWHTFNLTAAQAQPGPDATPDRSAPAPDRPASAGGRSS